MGIKLRKARAARGSSPTHMVLLQCKAGRLDRVRARTATATAPLAGRDRCVPTTQRRRVRPQATLAVASTRPPTTSRRSRGQGQDRARGKGCVLPCGLRRAQDQDHWVKGFRLPSGLERMGRPSLVLVLDKDLDPALDLVRCLAIPPWQAIVAVVHRA